MNSFTDTLDQTEKQLDRVGVGPRFLAGIIDLLVILGWIPIAVLIFQLQVDSSDPSSGAGISWYIMLIGLIAVPVLIVTNSLFEILTGSSLGQHALKIRVAMADGSSAETGTIVGRIILKYLSFCIWPIAAVSLILLFLEKKQTLHDKILNTAMFYKADLNG